MTPNKPSGSDLWGLLREFDIFSGVDDTARAEILDEILVRDVDCGDVLIRQGAPNRCVYLVLEGKLGVFLEALATEPVSVVEKGQTVGELSVLDQSPADANVIAVESSRVVVLSETAFWRLVEASHAFAVTLLRGFAGRMRTHYDRFSRTANERRDYERAAMYDGLTGVYNRAWADGALEEFAQEEAPFSVVLLDVDHFQRFKEAHGQAAGDFVLTKVAALFTRVLRGTDFVARYGDEEFILILPKAPADAAATVTERVRRALAAVSFEMKGTVLPPVTISAGVAQHQPRQSAEELVRCAHSALSRAKELGRNRVEVG